MAGINRLGKGPAKPGTMRPADPNKYKTSDFFSEGTEGDKDFQRMVQDIEDTQANHMGWLFGRGAFDKGDLLYLRDEEEKKRYAEQELREKESRAFNQMRQKVMSQQADSMYDANPAHMAKMTEKMTHSEALKNRIKVKPAANVKLKAEPGVRIKQEGPPEKKIKREVVKKEPSVKQEIKSEATVQEGTAPGLVRPNANQSSLAGEQSKTAQSQAVALDSDDPDEGGLGGLLGDYGSDSDTPEVKNPKKESLPLPDFFRSDDNKPPP